MSRGALQKLHRRSRFEKRTKLVCCTQSKKGSENRSSRFEPKISWISFSRGSGPPLKKERKKGSNSWRLFLLQASDGHSLRHSGNGIRKWSRNRCVFAPWIPIPIPIPSKFPWGGGVNTQSRFSRQKKHRLTQWLKLGVTIVMGGWGVVLVHHYFLQKKSSFWRDLNTWKNWDFLTQTASPTR